MAFKGQVNALRNKLGKRKKERKDVIATTEVTEKVTSPTRLTTTSPTSKNEQMLFSVESIASRSCQEGDRYQSNGTVVTEETTEESRDEEEETKDDGVEWDTALTKQYEEARLEAEKQCGDNESLWLRSHTLSKTNEMATPGSQVATQEQHQLWLRSHTLSKTNEMATPGSQVATQEQHQLWLRSHTLSKTNEMATPGSQVATQEQHQLWLRSHTLSKNKTTATQQQHLSHREVDLERQQSQLSESSLQVLYRLVATGIDFTTETRDFGDRIEDDNVSDDRDDYDYCDVSDEGDDGKNRTQGTNIPCADSQIDATVVCDNDDVTEVSTSLSGLSLTRTSDYRSNDAEETSYLNKWSCACFQMQNK
eukprot:CAMPEP_0178608248 /NCGR_PEP_ID=MMETSP0697-20121206/38036_1 /TAXON_ID=265572 /ORGANISM="Extubocellulus spinifer, Strain CCMP396" /LENGTH=364 /DNA_ID=CAMNT_0020246793 /DNA_START=58 /DNA_END=1152 /DNA_ORIENTATION=-